MDSRGGIFLDLTPEQIKDLERSKMSKLQREVDDLAAKIEASKAKIHLGNIPDDAVPIDKLPDPHCNDCYGRGHITRIIENIRKVEPCHCVKNRKPPIAPLGDGGKEK